MSNQELVTEVNTQITNEVNQEPGNTFTKPEFFQASEVKDVVDDGHPESPMEHIDNELRKLNVPEDKLQGWKRGYFQTEEEIDAYNKATRSEQMFCVNRLLRLYMGLMEENTRAERCALIDGVSYKEWRELMHDYILRIIAEHLTTGKWERINQELATPLKEDDEIVHIETGIETVDNATVAAEETPKETSAETITE